MLAAGYGAAWAADYEHPLIVRISPGRMDGEIAAVFPEDDQPSPGRGPRAIVAGLGSIWVLPAEGTRLIQVDPDSGATRSHELPFALSGISAGSEALFGIEPFGDGRLARIDPDGGLTEAPVGRTLRLIAAGGDLVWVVDDEPGLVLALDGRSLAKVAEFQHVGGPEALVASGSRAWYLASPEAERVGEHGRRGRALVITADGPGSDLLRFDAQTGSLDRLGRGPLPRAGWRWTMSDCGSRACATTNSLMRKTRRAVWTASTPTAAACSSWKGRDRSMLWRSATAPCGCRASGGPGRPTSRRCSARMAWSWAR